jgi:hypothetical protein
MSDGDFASLHPGYSFPLQKSARRGNGGRLDPERERGIAEVRIDGR